MTQRAERVGLFGRPRERRDVDRLQAPSPISVTYQHAELPALLLSSGSARHSPTATSPEPGPPHAGHLRAAREGGQPDDATRCAEERDYRLVGALHRLDRLEQTLDAGRQRNWALAEELGRQRAAYSQERGQLEALEDVVAALRENLVDLRLSGTGRGPGGTSTPSRH